MSAGTEILVELGRLRRLSLELIARELHEFVTRDISAPQILHMMVLGDRRLSIGELQADGAFDNVSYTIEKLIQAGYVQLAAPVADRRVKVIELTDKGHALIKRAEAIAATMFGGNQDALLTTLQGAARRLSGTLSAGWRAA